MLLSYRYATIAFKRLNLDVPNAEELACDDINEKLKDWNKVIVLFTLSLMLGPVIETIILLDRMIYLAENGELGKLKFRFSKSGKLIWKKIFGKNMIFDCSKDFKQFSWGEFHLFNSTETNLV